MVTVTWEMALYMDAMSQLVSLQDEYTIIQSFTTISMRVVKYVADVA